jgi:MFS family permease
VSGTSSDTGVPPGTPAGGSGEAGRIFGPEHRALTAGIVAVICLVAFEAMAVATAMPVAVRDLGGLRFYALAFSAFLTTSLLGMVVAGELCDRRGPLLPFGLAVVTFGAGLLLAGAATGMWLFVTGRAVQGFGAGLNIVALYVVVGRAYPEAMRPRLFSAMSSAWVLPALVGPSVAGLVADRLSWRWVFLAVPPLIVPAVLLMLPRLTHLPAAPPGVTVRRRIVPALAVAVGATLLQYAGQRLDWLALVLVAVAVAVLLPSLPRLLPGGTLAAHRGLPTAVLLRGVLAGAFFGAEAFLPLMLVEQRGLATAVAGLALTGGALSWSLGSWYQGRPGSRLTRATLVQRGTAVIALGIAIASLAVWDAVPPAVAAAGWVVAGLGMGVAMPSVNLVMLRLSPVAEQGFNSAALQVSDAVGSIVLIGLGGAVFAGLHQPGHAGGHNAAVFAAIYAVMAATAVAGALVAPRLQPRGDTR